MGPALAALLGLLLLSGGGARPQYFADPTRHFVKFSLDTLHRGSFNITGCARELLNCWETMKAETVCSSGVPFESVCGLLRRDCSEAEGWTSPEQAPIFESFCDRYP